MTCTRPHTHNIFTNVHLLVATRRPGPRSAGPRRPRTRLRSRAAHPASSRCRPAAGSPLRWRPAAAPCSAAPRAACGRRPPSGKRDERRRRMASIVSVSRGMALATKARGAHAAHPVGGRGRAGGEGALQVRFLLPERVGCRFGSPAPALGSQQRVQLRAAGRRRTRRAGRIRRGQGIAESQDDEKNRTRVLWRSRCHASAAARFSLYVLRYSRSCSSRARSASTRACSCATSFRSCSSFSSSACCEEGAKRAAADAR